MQRSSVIDTSALTNQRRYADQRTAGRELAAALDEYSQENTVVLAIAVGGLLIGAEVAERLQLPFDIILLRRLLVLDGPASQVCAVNVAGSLVVPQEVIREASDPKTPTDIFLRDALDQLAARHRICRGDRDAMDLKNKTVIVVDCGIRTGLTMAAALDAVREKAPARVLSAVPVSSREGLAVVEDVCDRVICLGLREPFGNVGVWYHDFSRPQDAEISALLR